MQDNKRLNKYLSLITFITSLGDFISLFAVIKLLEHTSGSIAIASYTVSVKSVGIVLGALTFPSLLNSVSLKIILTISQLLAGVLIAILASNTFLQPALIMLILLLQTIMDYYFGAAKQTYSKVISKDEDHRSYQAQLFKGFYSAQFIGPIISFLLISSFPITVPIWIDAISFFVASFMCIKVPMLKLHRNHSIAAPLQYLSNNAGLSLLFLVRAVLIWVPIGIYNYLIFSVIKEHYHMELIHTAWTYSAVGIGSIIGSILLLSNRSKLLKQFMDTEIAIFAFVMLGITRIALINLPSFILLLGLIIFAGIFNGLHVVALASLNRKMTTNKQFPEIASLTTVISKLTDWTISTGCFFLLSKHWITYVDGIWVSAISFWLLALMLLITKLKSFEKLLL